MSLLARLRAKLWQEHDFPLENLGSVTLEFALVVPVLLLTVTGILTLGITLNQALELTDAAFIGGQTIAVERGNTTNPCADAITATENAAPLLNASQLSFTFVLNGTTFGPYTGTGSTSTCTSGAADLVQGKSAKVTVTYPCVIAVYGNSNLMPGCQLPAQVTEIVQ